jgi:hypothetical protein
LTRLGPFDRFDVIREVYMTKMRSPNYPAYGLDEVVDRLKRFWGKEQGTSVSADVAAKAIGYIGLSGPARTYLAAMKKFGLLNEDNYGMRISPLGLRILHPESPEEQIKAIQEAALKPELFRELAETHTKASDDALKSYLINKLKFSGVGAKILTRSFKDTIGFAKLNQEAYRPNPGAISGEAMTATMQVGQGEMRTASTTKALRSFSWPLSADVTARLEIVGNEELTSEHIEALTQYLEVAKKLLKPAKN